MGGLRFTPPYLPPAPQPNRWMPRAQPFGRLQPRSGAWSLDAALVKHAAVEIDDGQPIREPGQVLAAGPQVFHCSGRRPRALADSGFDAVLNAVSRRSEFPG
jgi:hypothetical protein